MLLILLDFLTWDIVEIVNMTIGAVIGKILSIVTAYYYDKFKARRQQQELTKVFSEYESSHNQFDYQHWNILNGKIAEAPLHVFMNVRYRSGHTFDYEWTPTPGGRVEGSGKIVFDDFVTGKLYYFTHNTVNFNIRNFNYAELIEHNGNSTPAFSLTLLTKKQSM